MKLIRLLLMIIIVTCISSGILAQVKTKKKADKVENAIKDAGNQVNNLKDLFENKSTKKNTSDKTTTTENNKPIKQVSTKEKSNGLKPGDTHPNAATIDADELYPFNCGSAVIRKGTSAAIIDRYGKLVVPYNDSKRPVSIPSANKNMQNGIFKLTGPVYGAVNSQGKVINNKIVSNEYTTDGLFLIGDAAEGNIAPYTFLLIDSTGKKYSFKQRIEKVSEGIGVALVSKYAYKNIQDGFITNPVYDYTMPFSEGMAVVGRYNEFGEMKYGYIDKKGKEVIPLMYSNEPSSFQGGIAVVKPVDQSVFKYAYINKKGTIVKSFSSQEEAKWGGGNFYYAGCGFYHNSRFIMDSSGSIKPIDEFLAEFGIRTNTEGEKPSLWLNVLPGSPSDEKMLFMRPSKNKKYPGKVGFINMKTRTVVEAVFALDQKGFWFDPVSGLAPAKIITGFKDNGFAIYKEGYINREGIFMIVIGESSKW